MEPNQDCFDFIKSHEGFSLTAYQDSAGIWTIGYGSILYTDYSHVKKGETITQQLAEDLLAWEVSLKSKTVNSAVASVTLTQNQFNALVSFTYNVGIKALLCSTLLKRILANPDDDTITDAFMMWDKAHENGQLVVVDGLENRRIDEAALYFS